LRPRQVRPGVPKALEEIVCRAMARVPEERYDSAADLRAALLGAGAAPSPETDLTGTHVATAPAVPAPPLAPGAPATPLATAPATPSFRQTERSWLVPTLLLVALAVALGTAGLLLGRSGAGDILGGVKDAITGTPEAELVPISAVDAFDPSCDQSACAAGQRGGDGQENDDLAGFAIDDQGDTTWRTEGYNNRDITALKPGVGLVLQLASVQELTELQVDSPTNGWRAEVYVAGSDPGNLGGWGEPVATTDSLPAGTSSISLGDTEGGAVLIWITDRGDATGRAPAEIAEVRVSGR
jgi:hypothetical protein